MVIHTIKTRVTSYAEYETLTAKGSELTPQEVDDNWIGVLERLYDAIPVGVILPYLGSTAPSGFLISNGQSIGDTDSLAGLTNSKYKYLFILLWTESLSNATALGAIDIDNNPINFATTMLTGLQAWVAKCSINLPNSKDKFLKHKADAETLFKTGGGKTTDASHTHSNTLAIVAAGGHSHTISLSTSSDGSHTHTLTITVDAGGDHTHTVMTTPTTIGADAANAAANGTYTTSSSGNHTHTAAGSATSNGTHSHTVSGNTGSVSDHTHTISGSITSASLSTLSILNPFLNCNFIIKYSYGAI